MDYGSIRSIRYHFLPYLFLLFLVFSFLLLFQRNLIFSTIELNRRSHLICSDILNKWFVAILLWYYYCKLSKSIWYDTVDALYRIVLFTVHSLCLVVLLLFEWYRFKYPHVYFIIWWVIFVVRTSFSPNATAVKTAVGYVNNVTFLKCFHSDWVSFALDSHCLDIKFGFFFLLNNICSQFTTCFFFLSRKMCSILCFL